MASRQLRKLRKQQELLSLQNETGDRSDESDDELIVAKPRGNMFSGFAALGDAGDDGDDGDDGSDGGDKGRKESESDDAASPPAHQEQASRQEEPAKKSKKKSSKKKKKKGKQAETPAPAQDERESVDEIDRVLEELRLEAQPPGGPARGAPAAGEPTNGLNELLRINFQHLKAVNEMRRLFGKAMDVAEVEERTQDRQHRTLPQHMDLETFLSARAAHPGLGPGGNKGMFDTVLRANPFIDGKKSWPRSTAQGLKMVRITEASSGEVEFAYAHDKTYEDLEASFFGLVQMYDPMQIVYFLHRYPYHVSSLIQVSKVARQDQNSALAADLIERALFTFGRATLSEFRKKLEKGQARMSFARPENRQFYLAGHNLIQKLVLKGTYRTALEWAKLLLSINHSDPYAMINWIHVLAIRAREAQWFIDFCNSGILDSEDDNADGKIPAGAYAKQTLPLAYLQLKDLETAKSTLIKGMETLPWVYCALFSALNLDTPRSVWGNQPRDIDEQLHTELYIHMAKDLWNTPQTISLLKDAAAAAARVDDPWELPRGAPVSLATARFVYLDNTPALMVAVPRQMLHAAPNFDFDPLPPPLAENVFSSEAQRRPWLAVDHDAARAAFFAGAGREADEMRAAAARLMEELRLEVEEREERLRGRLGGGAGEHGGGAGGDVGEDDDIGEGPDAPQDPRDQRGGAEQPEGDGGRVRRFVRLPPEPGLLNYLSYLMNGTEMEIVDPDEEFQVPTGMPGGWGQGDGWEEEEDDWGQDEFEGVDDFEGGGGHDEEEGM
ncbi:7399bb83-4f5b-4dd3-b05f-8d32c8fce76b [Thermothielavioides terrestris]|uniref:7399bb83-4f5b-4dd3-b05f-8d32c8fce76b n=1 Tax=Thermothielavioides terrestris TaxID=2587410 RepID=A0A446BDE1_9PEZI|nr:7399bb83-4f5b-4dd3-b05f-8d32c8fce76b [Thermothielavioides terrestris]